jgi:hypothetical protein
MTKRNWKILIISAVATMLIFAVIFWPYIALKINSENGWQTSPTHINEKELPNYIAKANTGDLDAINALIDHYGELSNFTNSEYDIINGTDYNSIRGRYWSEKAVIYGDKNISDRFQSSYLIRAENEQLNPMDRREYALKSMEYGLYHNQCTREEPKNSCEGNRYYLKEAVAVLRELSREGRQLPTRAPPHPSPTR